MKWSTKKAEDEEIRWFKVFAVLPVTFPEERMTVWLSNYWIKKQYIKQFDCWVTIKESLKPPKDEPKYPEGFDKAEGVDTEA